MIFVYPKNKDRLERAQELADQCMELWRIAQRDDISIQQNLKRAHYKIQAEYKKIDLSIPSNVEKQLREFDEIFDQIESRNRRWSKRRAVFDAAGGITIIGISTLLASFLFADKNPNQAYVKACCSAIAVLGFNNFIALFNEKQKKKDLMNCIQGLYALRIKLKKLVLKLAELKLSLPSTLDTYQAFQIREALTEEEMSDFLKLIVQPDIKSIQKIDIEIAKAELIDLDATSNSWTSEDGQ